MEQITFSNGIFEKHWNLYKLNIWLWIHKKNKIQKIQTKQQIETDSDFS